MMHVDQSPKHYTKWKKSDTKGYILRHVICMKHPKVGKSIEIECQGHRGAPTYQVRGGVGLTYPFENLLKAIDYLPLIKSFFIHEQEGQG